MSCGGSCARVCSSVVAAFFTTFRTTASHDGTIKFHLPLDLFVDNQEFFLCVCKSDISFWKRFLWVHFCFRSFIPTICAPLSSLFASKAYISKICASKSKKQPYKVAKKTINEVEHQLRGGGQVKKSCGDGERNPVVVGRRNVLEKNVSRKTDRTPIWYNLRTKASNYLVNIFSKSKNSWKDFAKKKEWT